MFPKVFVSSVQLAIAVASLVASYFAGHPVQAYLFNSDAVFFPRLFSNLFDGGGSIVDWYLTPAPYFFPDYIIFLGAYFLGESIYTQIIIFSVLQTSLTFAATYFLSKQIVKNNAFFVSALVTVLLVWLSLNAGERSDLFVYMLFSGYHYGGFLSGMVFIALVVKYLNCDTDKQKGQILFGLCLLAFLTSLSDNLFLVQVLVPLSGSLIFVNLMTREKRVKNYLPAIIPFPYGILGSLLYSAIVVNKPRYFFIIGLEKVGANFSDYFSILQDFFIRAPFFGFYFIVFLIFSFLCMIVLFKRRFFLNLPKEIIQLIVFALFSIGATIIIILLITTLPATNRYLMTVFIWPVLIGAIVAAYLLRDKFFYFSSAISVVVSIFLCVNSFWLIKNNGIAENFYPGEISCIDTALAEENLNNGIAGYWDAKHIEAFSKNRISLAQYLNNLDEYRWITSKKFFKSNYDFAIVSENAEPPYKISKEKLIAINGAPRKTKACGNRTLLIYGKEQLRVREIVSASDSYK